MINEIDEILKKRKIKPTAMRILVLKELLTKNKAINLYELENNFDKVERTTLYRTLKTFVDYNLIHKIDDGTGSVKYAICDDNCNCKFDDLHVHFLCVKCEKTFCLKDIPIPLVKLPDNMIFETANYVIKGICEKCSKR